jgi:hypothetical protein
VSDGPVPCGGVAIEEAESADGLIEAAPGALLLFDEVNLVGANVLSAELFGRAE